LLLLHTTPESEAQKLDKKIPDYQSILTGFLEGGSWTLDSVDETQPMMYEFDVILCYCSMKNPVYSREMTIRLEAKGVFFNARKSATLSMIEKDSYRYQYWFTEKDYGRLSAELNFRKGVKSSFIRPARCSLRNRMNK
jgi:hypothetical protein